MVIAARRTSRSSAIRAEMKDLGLSSGVSALWLTIAAGIAVNALSTVLTLLAF